MRSVLILLVAFLLAGCGKKEVSYREKIQPILTARCVPCHGPNLAYDKVLLSSYQEVMNSKARSGKQPIVTPGNLEESRLYVLCATLQKQFRMPPDTSHNIPLPNEDLVLISKWIMQGAKDN
jgi:hypothetical protein